MAPDPRQTNMMKVMNFIPAHHDTYPFISPEKADFSGKSVLITGASQGIGRAMAASFAAAGCSRIALAARSSLAATEAEVREAAAARRGGTAADTAPIQILSLSLDVTSEDSVRAAADEVAAAFRGALDVVVANAGYLEEWGDVIDPARSADAWWRSWEVNIRGVYLCARYFIPLLLRGSSSSPGSNSGGGGGGTLVTVSSVGAHLISQGASAYQTTKFALCRLTEHLYAEYADRGLVAFAVHPGGVRTQLSLNMPERVHGSLNETPKLAADTFVWLCREPRAWLGGRFVSVTWDMEELEARRDEIVEKNLLRFQLLV